MTASREVAAENAPSADEKPLPAIEEASDDETPRPAVEAEINVVGRVNYGSARGELPVGSRVTLLAFTELLYLTPVASDNAHEFHPYVGAGAELDPGDDWNTEVSLAFGPRAAGVASIEGSFEVSKGFGADWDNDRAPTVEAEAAVNLVRFAWSPASAVGNEITQFYLQAGATVKLAPKLELNPRAIWFSYNNSLSLQTIADVDALSVLARVGTYAPRFLGGARIAFDITPWLSPLVEADELAYAAGIGSGTEIKAGARARWGQWMHASLAGGILHNHLAGVAATSTDPRTVPVVTASCEFRL